MWSTFFLLVAVRCFIEEALLVAVRCFIEEALEYS